MIAPQGLHGNTAKRGFRFPPHVGKGVIILLNEFRSAGVNQQRSEGIPGNVDLFPARLDVRLSGMYPGSTSRPGMRTNDRAVKSGNRFTGCTGQSRRQSASVSSSAAAWMVEFDRLRPAMSLSARSSIRRIASSEYNVSTSSFFHPDFHQGFLVHTRPSCRLLVFRPYLI